MGLHGIDSLASFAFPPQVLRSACCDSTRNVIQGGLDPRIRRLMVGKKLYVGNLTYRVSSSDLEQLFSQYGSVESAEVIADRDTGRSKGFGFVEMSNDTEARSAIDALNEQEHDGRRLTVNEARPREPRPGGGGGGGGGYRGGRWRWRRRWSRPFRWRWRRGYDTGVIDHSRSISSRTSKRSQFRNQRVPTLAPAGRFGCAEKNALRRQTLVAELSCAYLCANDEPRGASCGTAVHRR